MEVTEKVLSNCVIQTTITLTEEEILKYYPGTLNEIGKHISIKGFRKGHVPGNVVEKYVEKEYIMQEVSNKAIQKTFDNLVKEKKYELNSKPSVNVTGDSPFTFTVKFEIYPKFELGDHTKVDLKVKEIKIPKKDIEEQVTFFRKEIATFEEKEGEVKKGDFIDISGDYLEPETKEIIP